MNTPTVTAGDFQVSFSQRPGIAGFLNSRYNTMLPGNPGGLANLWTLYCTKSEKYTDIEDNSSQVSYQCLMQGNTVVWNASITFGEELLTAQIRGEIKEQSLVFTLGAFGETENSKIVMFRLNGLAAATQADCGARLALPAHGGRLIDPAACEDGQTDHRYNWILDSFGSAAVVYNQHSSAVVRITSMDDQLTSLVGGSPQNRYAQMGALLRHRYTVNDPSYRRAKPNRDPKNSEDESLLPIERDFETCTQTSVTVELISHEEVAPNTGWTVGAKAICQALPGKPSNLYKDKMIYKVFIGAPNMPVQTSLPQVRQLIFDLAQRTANAGQIPYLVGFHHQGHDSAYPDVYTLNPALESIEALEQLAKDAKEVNCLLSFHDNFDDAYANSPSWDSEDISRDNTGHLLRGGVWNGVQAYWNSMPHYAKTKAAARIQKTIETYPFIKDTYHLDVLTASVFRIDFRGGSPSGREEDLQARLDIVKGFRQKGLDVTSEACGLPFVGTISYFWHMQRIPRSLYQGDQRIPMAPFLAHGKADYAGTHTDSLHNILEGLLYGGFYCNDVTAATPIKELTDAYFMLQAPLNLIRDEYALFYQEHNGFKTVTYSDGSTISVNFETEECYADIRGVRMVENGCAMVPQADGSTLIYRSCEEPYTPVKWSSGFAPGTTFNATPLGVDVPAESLTANEGGLVDIELPIGIAYRVNSVE